MVRPNAEAVITVLACNLIWLTKLMMIIPKNSQTARKMEVAATS